MNIIPKSFDFSSDDAIKHIIETLRAREEELNLSDAHVFLEFPLYKDDDDSVIMTQVLIVSPKHGIIIIYSTELPRYDEKLLSKEDKVLDKIAGHITSKLFKNDNLRTGLMGLAVPVDAVLFARNISQPEQQAFKTRHKLICGNADFISFFRSDHEEEIDSSLIEEAISSLQGAKGLLRPVERDIADHAPNSKVAKVHSVESKILKFDNDQQDGYIPAIDGPHRIRGLAGSGKTVILSMKVVQTLLRESSRNTTVLYTFSTKSLYQHVKRLIHRFFREFHDDMSYLDCVKVLHAWGGRTNPGVYYNACVAHGVSPMTLTRAQSLAASAGMDAFEYACKSLLDSVDIQPQYDYVFVDEAQDYGKHYLLLCTKLAKGNRVTFGSDVFQNIFQPKVITAQEIFGNAITFKQDDFLETCYRTPLSILVSAHAVGLGVYGEQVQVIESVDSWKGFGYEVLSRKEGDFEESEFITVSRNYKKSPTLVEELPDSLISTNSGFPSIEAESEYVAGKIIHDIKEEGLLPEDILVICMDDRACSKYFSEITDVLSINEVQTNNIHANKYSINDFQVKGRVTLSTVHKAKGNEAYSVYLVGCDSLCHNLNLKSRNLLFTAMTRTKGWLHMSAYGHAAIPLFGEIETAKGNCPEIRFSFPSSEGLARIQMDLKKQDHSLTSERRKLQRLAEQVGGTDALERLLKEMKAGEEKQ